MSHRERLGPLRAVVEDALRADAEQLRATADAFKSSLRVADDCRRRRRERSDARLLPSLVHVEPRAKENEDGNRRTSAIDQWSHVDSLLASLDDCIPLPRELMATTAYAARRRDRGSTPTVEKRRRIIDCDASNQELMKRVMREWRAVTVNAQRKSKQIAMALAVRRRACLGRVLNAWRCVCHSNRILYQRADVAAEAAARSLLLKTLHVWLIMRRRATASRRLRRVARISRLSVFFRSWIHFQTLLRAATKWNAQRCHSTQRLVWIAWRGFVDCSRRARHCTEVSTRFRLKSVFHQFTMAIRLRRKQSVTMCEFRARHERAMLRFVLLQWDTFLDRRRRQKLATLWRTNYLLERCFLTWRSVCAHRRRQHARLLLIIAVIRRVVLMSLWQRWALYREQHNAAKRGLQNLIDRLARRAAWRKLLQQALEAENREQKLMSWRCRRRLQNWSQHARRRAERRARGASVANQFRLYELKTLAWHPWRQALVRLERERTLFLVARRNAIARWWRQWLSWLSSKKTKRATLLIVDEERRRRHLRHAVRRWLIAAATIQHWREQNERARANDDLRLLRRSWDAWKCLRQRRWLEIQAQRHCVRATLREFLWRWCDGAQSEIEHGNAKVDFWRKHRAKHWRLRSMLAQWRRQVTSRVQSRLMRVFHRWRRGVECLLRHKCLVSIISKVKLRCAWLSWRSWHHRQVALSDCADAVALRHRAYVLRFVLYDVWYEKARRHRLARARLQHLANHISLRVSWSVWLRYIKRCRERTRAKSWHRHQLQRHYLQRWHDLIIRQPRELQRRHINRVRRQVLYQWRTLTRERRMWCLAGRVLGASRQRSAINRWRTHVERSQRHAHQVVCALRMNSRAVMRQVLRRWEHFVETQRRASHVARIARRKALQAVVNRWRRSFVQQLQIHAAEKRLEIARLRAAWQQFISAASRRRQTRQLWIRSLQAWRLSKMWRMWREQVMRSHAQQNDCDLIRQRHNQRHVRAAFHLWIQFIAIRGFVALRRRRQHESSLNKAFRAWRVGAWRRRHRRQRRTRLARYVLHSFRRLALMQQASREMTWKWHRRDMQIAWKRWRLEFWLRQSQKQKENTVRRAALAAWRQFVDEERRVRGADGYIRRLHRVEHNRHVTFPLCVDRSVSFKEAMALQHRARCQRQQVLEAFSAWALAAKSSKHAQSYGRLNAHNKRPAISPSTATATMQWSSQLL